MTIRFAAARGARSPLAWPVRCSSASLTASNDNHAEAGTLTRNATVPLNASLSRALIHFSRFGLSAASRARDSALVAHAQADVETYYHWLEICRHLDRRMARQLAIVTGRGMAGHA